jgi:glycosyltransferase involved in cell wall biosynthesis/peptidoglycan/xylan/chitin deacetylase (PgdA/CDA1 family)
MIDVSLTPRQRVLLLAFECSPNHGSEWANGWNRALEAAKLFDTTLITLGGAQQAEINAWLAVHGPVHGLRIEFIPCDAFKKYPTHVGGRLWIAYRGWQQQAFELAQRLHTAEPFEMIHHITNTGFREPGYAWQLDAPFVWGPIGGTHNYPWRFLLEAGWRGALSEGLRGVANTIQLRYSRRVAQAAQQARLMLAANSTSCEQFRERHGVRPVRMLDVGILKVTDHPKPGRDTGRPLHILWSAQFAPRKALSLLLKALARLPKDLNYKLRVVGGGPLEKRWKRLANRLGVSAHVDWAGWLPHAEAQRQYAWADVFAFTSLRDNSGTVVLEAMGAGVPIICLDHQGVRDVVTEECGIKVPVSTPRQVIMDLTAAIIHLANNEPLRARLGAAAIERARDYTWKNLGSQMAVLYRGVLTDPAPVSEPVTVLRQPRPTVKASLREGAIWSVARVAAALNAARPAYTSNEFGILAYHRVAEKTSGIPAPTWNCTPEQLHSQLSGLLSRGFNAWSLSAVLQARREGRPLPPRVFVVTFDDGYENNYLNALPVLESLGVPATIYLATSFIDSSSRFPFDDWCASGSRLAPPSSWRPLASRQCRHLLESGLIELGTHTHTHRKLRDEPEEFRKDLTTSVDFLRDHFGIQQTTLAFPHGIFTPAMIEVARQVGIASALSTCPHLNSLNSDPMQWGRFNVESHDTAATLAGKLSGWYTFVVNQLRVLRRSTAARPPIHKSRASEVLDHSYDVATAPVEVDALASRD